MKKISVIIVAYKNMDCLAECLASIPDDPSIEVIVVNNTHQNRGFGAGCNLGASVASADYLLFLNPDSVVSKESIEGIVAKLDQDAQIGMLGPALTNARGEIQPSSSQQPNRLSAFVVYSFLNRVLARSLMVKRHWYKGEGFKSRQVGIVSGAAIGMRREVFVKIGKFDEKFFLYWEEVDLAKRCLRAGYKVVYMPEVKIVHHGALSTLLPKNLIMTWFRESRFRFFQKHFGLIYGLVLEGWLAVSEHWQLSLVLLGLAGFTAKAGYIPIAGAMAGAVMIYNESCAFMSKSMAGLAGFVFGIGTLWAGNMGGFLLIVAGGWIVFDLLPYLSKFRKFYLITALMVGLWSML